MAAGGCAHKPPSPIVAEPLPPPIKSRVKLAVLPVDADQFPQVAATLNNSFRGVKVKGVDDYFLSKVTLEVVQLSIECVQPSSDCYSQVGKSLSANRLLLGQVAAVGKKRNRAVRVTITLFDVDAGQAVNVIDHVYKTAAEASVGAPELVTEAVGEPRTGAAPEAGKPGEAKPGAGDARPEQSPKSDAPKSTEPARVARGAAS
jgi:hypothetical protein